MLILVREVDKQDTLCYTEEGEVCTDDMTLAIKFIRGIINKKIGNLDYMVIKNDTIEDAKNCIQVGDCINFIGKVCAMAIQSASESI